MKKSIIAKIISIIFIITLIIGCVSIFFLPELYDLLKVSNVKEFSNQTLLYKIAFYTCYIICLSIIYTLIGLFNNVHKGTPFTKKVENALKINAILFMVLSIIVTIKIIFIPTLLSFVVAFVCFIVSLSFYVLKEVIRSAIIYKKEVDYTV